MIQTPRGRTSASVHNPCISGGGGRGAAVGYSGTGGIANRGREQHFGGDHHGQLSTGGRGGRGAPGGRGGRGVRGAASRTSTDQGGSSGARPGGRPPMPTMVTRQQNGIGVPTVTNRRRGGGGGGAATASRAGYSRNTATPRTTSRPRDYSVTAAEVYAPIDTAATDWCNKKLPTVLRNASKAAWQQDGGKVLEASIHTCLAKPATQQLKKASMKEVQYGGG